MALIQTLAPALEPVTLAEAKSFLRLDQDDENAFVASLNQTSRLQIETALDVALINQEWRWTGPYRPGEAIALRRHPLVSVEAAFEIADDDTETPLPAELVTVNTDNRPARVTIESASSSRVSVVFRAGFGVSPETVPAPIRQALLLLVAHWHENREPIAVAGPAQPIPMTVSDLLAPYRELRL